MAMKKSWNSKRLGSRHQGTIVFVIKKNESNSGEPRISQALDALKVKVSTFHIVLLNKDIYMQNKTRFTSVFFVLKARRHVNCSRGRRFISYLVHSDPPIIFDLIHFRFHLCSFHLGYFIMYYYRHIECIFYSIPWAIELHFATLAKSYRF